MTRFAERIRELTRQGAEPWRAAPEGAIAGYDRKGSIFVRTVRQALIVLGAAVLAVVAAAYIAGYGIATPSETRVLESIRSRIGARALDPDEVEAFAAVPASVMRTVATLIRPDDPLADSNLGTGVSPVWTPDPRRVEALVRLTRWLAARDSQSMPILIEDLGRLTIAANDRDVRSGYEQINQLTSEERQLLFESPGIFMRIVTIIENLDLAENTAVAVEKSAREQRLKFIRREEEANATLTALQSEIGKLNAGQNRKIEALRSDRYRLSEFNRCYDSAFMRTR